MQAPPRHLPEEEAVPGERDVAMQQGWYFRLIITQVFRAYWVMHFNCLV